MMALDIELRLMELASLIRSQDVLMWNMRIHTSLLR
jgi:hypothetical protein